MAVPKKKLSNTRSNQRRAHLNKGRLTLAICSHCKATTLPHTVCQSCGYYRGKKVI